MYFDSFTFFIGLQSNETEGEALSDDDFQNESVFTRRTTAEGAERQRVQQGKAKVCVTTDGSTGCCDRNQNDIIYSSYCHKTHCMQCMVHNGCRQTHSSGSVGSFSPTVLK